MSPPATMFCGNAAHPHAVTTAGTWALAYDANGNMTSRAGSTISWYSYNLPNLINYGTSSAQFFYNASHQRWKQIANYAGTVETTHYVGGLLEVMTKGTVTEYRHQIPAGSASAIYTRRTSGANSTYYATSDHLGSADLVMDSTATVLARESFTPIGARRGSNWQGVPTTADYTTFDTTTRRGFTGHEMLDSVSLVHMNGRVHDPYLARFISADTVIQNLAATQSVNPYSYAWNDPLKYVNPSGHSLLDIIGAIVGIVVAIFAPYAIAAYEATLGAALTVTSMAMIAGFAGGFVGALIATGRLSAALTAGLISGLTAGAFNAIGGAAGKAGAAGSWSTGERVLAHAAVGCGSAMLSGGNCGRGALAAALSEEAVRQHWIKVEAIGSWGSFRGAAESGLLGGVSSEITGGKFGDGFSVAAAGYLFNASSHAGNADSSAAKGLANAWAKFGSWLAGVFTRLSSFDPTEPGVSARAASLLSLPNKDRVIVAAGAAVAMGGVPAAALLSAADLPTTMAVTWNAGKLLLPGIGGGRGRGGLIGPGKYRITRDRRQY